MYAIDIFKYIKMKPCMSAPTTLFPKLVKFRTCGSFLAIPERRKNSPARNWPTNKLNILHTARVIIRQRFSFPLIMISKGPIGHVQNFCVPLKVHCRKQKNETNARGSREFNVGHVLNLHAPKNNKYGRVVYAR